MMIVTFQNDERKEANARINCDSQLQDLFPDFYKNLESNDQNFYL